MITPSRNAFVGAQHCSAPTRQDLALLSRRFFTVLSDIEAQRETCHADRSLRSEEPLFLLVSILPGQILGLEV